MADNYVHMSEMIKDIPAEGIAWLMNVFSKNPKEYENQDAELRSLLSVDENADLDCWPDFAYEVEESSLWLYAEGGIDLQHVEILVRELITRFMPDFIFSCTVAETCSKPRISEFGGSWMVVSKDETKGGGTWSAANAAIKEMQKEVV